LTAGIAAFGGASLIRPARAAGSATYFAGCFHDAAAAPDSHLMRYLVVPERGRIPAALANDHGAELRLLAEDLLREKPEFGKAAVLGTDEQAGNPLFLGISRAMHESIEVHQPGTPAEYLTVISVTATLDVVTGHAAFRNTNRFETLYSLLLVTNQAIQQRTPFTEAELQEHYRRIAREALAGVLDRGTREFADLRERAKAVFQVGLFKLPDPLPPELDQLIASANRADGSADRAGEIERLTRECRHMLNFAIRDELGRRKIFDIALLPPQSPWTSGRALRQLQTRLRLADEPIIETPDPAKMNGYEIRGAVVKTWSQVASTNTVGQVIQVNAQCGSRIVRQCGPRLDQVPDEITDPAKKLGLGYGYRTYSKIVEIDRVATRDIAIGALRDSLVDLSKQTVELMQKTAAGFGCS
jgi:hypothetical protein